MSNKLNRTMSYSDINNAVKGFLESLEEHGVNDYTTLKTILNKMKNEIYYSDKYDESRERHFEHYRQVKDTMMKNEIKRVLISRGQEYLVEEAMELYDSKDIIFFGVKHFLEELEALRCKKAIEQENKLLAQLDEAIEGLKELGTTVDVNFH